MVGPRLKSPREKKKDRKSLAAAPRPLPKGWEDKAVEDILAEELRDSLSTIREIRASGRKEDNRLKAAMFWVNKLVADKHKVEADVKGTLTVEVVRYEK